METPIKWLCERIAALRGARNLLRSVRLAAHLPKII